MITAIINYVYSLFATSQECDAEPLAAYEIVQEPKEAPSQEPTEAPSQEPTDAPVRPVRKPKSKKRQLPAEIRRTTKSFVR